MATIFAATSLELEPEKKKELIDALGETIGTIFKTYSLYYTPVPAENVSEGAKDQMTFFVFVPPYMEIDRRRLVFAVKAYDETGLIGEGKHERFIVDMDKFTAKCEAKMAK